MLFKSPVYVEMRIRVYFFLYAYVESRIRVYKILYAYLGSVFGAIHDDFFYFRTKKIDFCEHFWPSPNAYLHLQLHFI